MRHHFYGDEQASYKVAILVNNIRLDDIQRIYLNKGIPESDIIILDLHRDRSKKKTPVAELKRYVVEELQPVLDDLKVEYVMACDSEYFKLLTKSAKADAMSGYVLDSEYGPQKVAYVPNFEQVFYDPDRVKVKIKQGIDAICAYQDGSYAPPGLDIVKLSAYPSTVLEIRDWLNKLIREDRDLTCDIEAFSLKHVDAGIGTMTLCWNQEEGIAFPVDYGLSELDAMKVRKLLVDFFRRFKRKIIYHNIAYDAYVLIYQLFMKNILDQEGMLDGLQVMLKNWDDTKLITYLATNSCAGNKLGLKEQAQEFAGNYAKDDIKDITKIPVKELLQYNLVDGVSTWYVHGKYYQKMVDDNQLEIYETIFKPAIVDIIQMQLTGMPVKMERVKEVRAILQADNDDAVARMNSGTLVQKFNYQLLEAYTAKCNSEWVNKRMTVTEMEAHSLIHEPTRDAVSFNPNSGPKLQSLLYEMCGLPIIATTKSGQASTDGDTLASLKNHTTDPAVLHFLDALIDYKAVDKILTSFIPAMEQAALGPDGWHYLFGNFNLGGTLSGRLSSSDPNLQNLPATGSKYAKLIKSCFVAPPGWFFTGIDFNSLEDRISALTTKDPNKLKVYTDGYDGHCLRAFAYFGDQMTGIIDGNVASINSIAKLYKSLRQDSKIPTFSLTYAGTYITIMKSQGWPKEKAQKIEKAYHDLYKVSDQWVSDKLDAAMVDGYITGAFGLRLRTPLLKQVIRGTRKTPHEAEAEGRTAGNALGQSWCLLNSRAGTEFMLKVRNSKFRLDIKPCAQIHDAQYYLIRDNIDAIMYANEHVVKACEWQNHPDIWHPDVKLGGEFSIFYPSWKDEMGIPNNASAEDIYSAVEKHMDKLAEAA